MGRKIYTEIAGEGVGCFQWGALSCSAAVFSSPDPRQTLPAACMTLLRATSASNSLSQSRSPKTCIPSAPNEVDDAYSSLDPGWNVTAYILGGRNDQIGEEQDTKSDLGLQLALPVPRRGYDIGLQEGHEIPQNRGGQGERRGERTAKCGIQGGRTLA